MNVDKETFESLPVEKQNSVLFDGIEELRALLVRKRKIDTALTAAAGFVGGICAVAGKWFFLKK